MNIVCVLSVENTKKTKITYTEEWVDKLYRAVNRNYAKPYNFFCLSNVKTKYQTLPLEHNFSGFWNKIELFRYFKEPTLYFDLDVVIMNNFTDLVDQFTDYEFLMTEEPYQQIPNSSIMYWKNDYSHLFNEFLENKESIMQEYKKVPRYGDQAYISERVNYRFVTDIVKNSISWQHHKVNTLVDESSNFLIFTSHQSKPNNSGLEIVKRNWT